MKKQLLLLVMMLLPMVVSAYDFEVDGIYYSITSVEEKTVGVTYDNNAFLKTYNGDIVIPSKVVYKGIEFTVTSILHVAFGCWNGGVITSIQLPETIKLIDSQAFWACRYLKEINLPNSLEVINYGAFAECTSLKKVVIPNSVTEINDLQTNRGIFQGCTSLETVVLSENIRKIPYRAFYNCPNLVEIEIPQYVESIGDEAFCNCKKIKDIVIPEHVNYIGYKSFDSCEDLESIKCLSSTPPNMYESFTNSHYMFANLVVPPGTKKAYKSDANWGKFMNIEEEIGEIYNLVYYLDDEVYKAYEIRHGTAITPEPAPIKEGYTFNGWSEIPETMPAHDVTVTGTFSINKYKLTYTVDGEEYKSYDVEYGASITVETVPTKEGHTFSGWSEIPETMPAHDVTITGTFTINKYKLTYTVDGEEYKTYEVEFGANITPEAEPTKEGYTFSGWSEIPETMPAHDVTVTGTFRINKYKLIYTVDGEEYKTYEVVYGATITPEMEPTKEGYTFSGWSEIPETMPAHDVTITGTFSINKYKLTYTVDGAEYKTYEVEYGATITPEAEPTKEGYTFSGWSEIPKTMPAHDVTVTGTFSINKYKLTYTVDGEEYKTYEVEFGANITPEAEPTKEGYTFSGWSEIPETMPAHNVTVTGTFSINKYKLIYVVDGAEYKTYEIEYGAAITPEAEPTEEGYTFSGWSEIPETMPAHDVKITGTFTKGEYKLTYYVDGVVYKTVSYDYGATITPEAEPTKEGYTFSGWSEIPFTMPPYDVTVTGSFNINSYKLTYMIDNKVYKETMYEYGATIIAEPQPEGDYDTFEWIDLPQTMPAHDVVVYASYTSGIIEVLMAAQHNVRIYSPNGKKLNKLQKGLNIVIFDDGTVKKVMMK